MSIKKKYLESKSECKVTFKLEKNKVNSANQAVLVGEFNSWDRTQTPMKRLKSGDFSVTINLATDKAYQFKYLLDDKEWINESTADNFVPNEFQGENSVVEI